MPSPSVSFSPSGTYEEALSRAADTFGIEREYWDIWGNHHRAQAEDISAVLGSMRIGVSSKDEIDRAVESRL